MSVEHDDLLIKEVNRRLLLPHFRLKTGLFDKQLEFRADNSTFKAALCTRRAGKSHLAAVLLFENAYKWPGSTCLYVGLTRASVENIMWPILKELKEKYKINCEILDSSLEVKLPNGSRIWCVGADMKNFIPRLLGGAYPIGIIDEAQSFRSHIEELVDDVLTPAILDYNGSIVMFGTPGPIPNGYFHDVTEKRLNGFSLHKWSIFQNPYLPDAREFVDKLMARKNWTVENPTYRRQYLGEWVQDFDSLVYKFKEGFNEYQEIPNRKDSDWNRIIGVDYGFNDKTTFSIASYNRYSPKIYIEHSEGHAEWIPSQIAERLKQLIDRYDPIKIVADTGGLGKSITEEMVRRYAIPIKAAQKTDKLSFISLMNGDFIDGNLLVHESLTELKHQYISLTKSDDGLEDPNLPNDYCDSSLYAWREAKSYHPDREVKIPKTSVERSEAIERQLLIEQEDAMMKDNDGDWWER